MAAKKKTSNSSGQNSANPALFKSYEDAVARNASARNGTVNTQVSTTGNSESTASALKDAKKEAELRSLKEGGAKPARRRITKPMKKY